MEPPRPLVLVVGVGNLSRGDDAVGRLVARLVRDRLAGTPGVSFVECDGDLTPLVDRWAGARAAIIIDAVRSGAPPGRLHRVNASTTPLPTAFRRTSSHAWGLADAIELARALGTLPPTVVVYGIEARAFAPGSALSPEVEAAAVIAAGRIARAARRFVRQSGIGHAHPRRVTPRRGPNRVYVR